MELPSRQKSIDHPSDPPHSIHPNEKNNNNNDENQEPQGLSLSPSSPPPQLQSLPLPLTSPLRTHPKRLLPPHLSSTYPHGHLSGLPRTPTQQAHFESLRTGFLLGGMSVKEMEKRYEELAGEVRGLVEEREERRRVVEGEREKLRGARDMERRVWGKLRGERGG